MEIVKHACARDAAIYVKNVLTFETIEYYSMSPCIREAVDLYCGLSNEFIISWWGWGKENIHHIQYFWLVQFE